MMTKLKKWIIALLFGSVILAAPLAMPDKSFEKLDNVQKISDRYEINFGGGSKVKMGGSGVDFKPHVKLGKWGDEVEINVWLETDKKIKPKQKDKKLKWIEKKREVHFYTIGDDKFEFEIILNERPDSNITELKIDSRGLEFYHQPALNIEMAGRDCWTDACTETDCCDSHRPENIIGSYAVYHESKAGDYSKMGKKNYRAGKAFHIYRPKIIDNAGKEVWGKLNITDNLLSVEIPQEFLDTCQYPVRHAAGLTFGCDPASPGGTDWYISMSAQNPGVTHASKFTGAAGTATGISAYIYRTEANHNGKAGIYKDSDKGLITNGDTGEEIIGTSYSWNDFTFSTNPTIEAIDYWLAIATAYDNSDTFYIKYDTGDTNQGAVDEDTYLPATLTPAYFNNKYSIYCTYTAGGAEERRVIKIE